MDINNKNKRPKVNIPKSNIESIIGVISILGVIIAWIYLIASWINLPYEIPTHFGSSGKADSWGGRYSLLILPILTSVLHILLTTVSKYPQHFNYVVNITEENAKRQYKNARTLIVCLKMEIIAIFLYLEWQSVQVAMNKSTGLGLWFLPIFLIVVFGTLGVCIYKMFKLK
ncbi:DUF1648 domain-containing protein [Clostridium uliginosum]|uniref:DUF1648 domain-containing protein n=1 Tax=Clostridium uliginosum TaxID=119641 RepID=A0A1I1MLZ6_9CLOT|nr:DUF1648 domain-containing protein [Clostridium uliginosum]SFC86439.1 Protein of unknown function [Clostridium uliginosum]